MDLENKREGISGEFQYERYNYTLGFINGNHVHPDGTVGRIIVNTADLQSLIGNVYVTETNSGKSMRWKIKRIGDRSENYILTIEVLEGTRFFIFSHTIIQQKL